MMQVVSSGVGPALIAAILWGLAYTIDQRVLKDVSVGGLFFFDALLTAIVAIPLIARYRASALSMLHAGPITLLWASVALLLTMVASYCILTGIKESSASIASIIEIAYPCFVVLFSAIAFRQIPSATVLIGGLVTIIGVSIVVYGAASASKRATPIVVHATNNTEGALCGAPTNKAAFPGSGTLAD